MIGETTVRMTISLLSLLVRDYDEAIAFYTKKLGFELLEDTDLGGGKRWVRIRPRGAGGRVFAFIETDDFHRDYDRLKAAGVRFTAAPRRESYGLVAVFEDLYGNRLDLIQPAAG